MKARILAPLLALSLLLSGCAALLDRPYAVVEPQIGRASCRERVSHPV